MRIDDAIVAYLEPAQWAALAAELGLDWAALPGESDSQRAAALVTAAARRGRLAELPARLTAFRPDVAWADLPTPLPTLRALHADLCRRLSLDGLRTLCFRLGIDFDDLPGDSKAGRARELVLVLERAGRIHEVRWGGGKSGWRVAGGGNEFNPDSHRRDGIDTEENSGVFCVYPWNPRLSASNYLCTSTTTPSSAQS